LRRLGREATMVSFVVRVRTFLREVQAEWRRVSFLTRKQVAASTAVVLVAVLMVAFFLGIVDVGLSQLITLSLRIR